MKITKVCVREREREIVNIFNAEGLDTRVKRAVNTDIEMTNLMGDKRFKF